MKVAKGHPGGDSVDGRGGRRSGTVGLVALLLLERALIAPDMFALLSALSHFGLLISSPHPPPLFFVTVIARHLFFLFCSFPPLYRHRGFFLEARFGDFGDERDEIIPIPALPLSRSHSLTKLSASILAPAARENSVCHLQST